MKKNASFTLAFFSKCYVVCHNGTLLSKFLTHLFFSIGIGKSMCLISHLEKQLICFVIDQILRLDFKGFIEGIYFLRNLISETRSIDVSTMGRFPDVGFFPGGSFSEGNDVHFMYPCRLLRTSQWRRVQHFLYDSQLPFSSIQNKQIWQISCFYSTLDDFLQCCVIIDFFVLDLVSTIALGIFKSFHQAW